jgi:2-dehydro-3-deoxyphosphogluconate aldolase / (4S)-4-hydroxy-2-oxoglutarate aldolase
MRSDDVRQRIEEIGIIPCARVKLPEHALFAAETLYAASIPVVEVTLTLPQATEIIADLARRYPDMVVGAGTVLDEQGAQRSIAAGARFITSPGFIPEVVACAKQANVVVFPGALTPSEVIAAWKAGSDFVKIFPSATAGGTHYVRALKVPLPQIPLIVTGGVNQLTAFDYILAGASAIGVGGELLPKEALTKKQAERIRELARRFLLMVKTARAQRDQE